MLGSDPIAHSRPTIGEAELEAVARVMRSGNIAQGREVEAFEAECAEFVGRKHAVAVNSGTAALHLALGALGVDSETRVAIPAYACAALLTAVELQGGRTVLCDVARDFNLDPAEIPDGCAVSVVTHLFGSPGLLPDRTTAIEDIAQAMDGTLGRATSIAITSFYATKLMTTGEGGMLFTDDAGLAGYARDRRDYDNRDDFRGRFNYKLTDMQAAMGRVQLRRLPAFIARRREIAASYSAAFEGLPCELPSAPGHVCFRYVVASDRRDDLVMALRKCGIEAKRPVYRPAHHYLKNGAEIGNRVESAGTLAGAERAHACALSLPIYPSLVEEDISRVIDSVIRFFG